MYCTEINDEVGDERAIYGLPINVFNLRGLTIRLPRNIYGDMKNYSFFDTVTKSFFWIMKMILNSDI